MAEIGGKRGKKEDPALVSVDGWDELVRKVGGGGWDLGMREVCEILRCSRDWAVRYVRPNVPHLYVAGGYATKDGQPYRKGTPWTRLLARDIGERYGEGQARKVGSASLLFDRAAFWRLVASHGTWLARTKRIDCARLVPKDEAEKIAARFGAAAAAQAGGDGLEARLAADKAARNMASALLSASEVSREGIAMPADRPSAPWTEVPAPEMPWRGMETAASMAGWGESSEEVYRRIHMAGMWRLELSLPDANGEAGCRILYVPDPDPVVDLSRPSYPIDWYPTDDGGYYVTVTWAEWLRVRGLYGDCAGGA